MTNFTISITADTVCPWCYVGSKKLSAGISLYRTRHPTTTDTFTTTWLPYQLNPSMPSPSIDKGEYMNSRFGAERVAAMYPRLVQVGKSVGIDFKFGGKIGNTRDSHRLIHLVKERKGVAEQNLVVAALQRRYFEEEGDVGDLATLAQVAAGCGLEEKEVKGWLESGAGGEEVDKELLAARKSGISGVPHFLLQGKYEIGGAQDAEAFVGMFEKIKVLEEK